MSLSIYPIGSSSLENPDQHSGRAWLPTDQVQGAQFQQRLGASWTPNTQTFRAPGGFGVEPFFAFPAPSKLSQILARKRGAQIMREEVPHLPRSWDFQEQTTNKCRNG